MSKAALRALVRPERQDGWRRDKAARAYDWGMPTCMMAAFSMAGLKYSAYLALKEGSEKARTPAVDEGLIERIFKDLHKWTDIQAKLGELNSRIDQAAAKTETPTP